MKYNQCFLPNGQRINVNPSFGGFKFAVDDDSLYGSFPPGWSISLYTENLDEGKPSINEDSQSPISHDSPFTKPTLLGDVLHLSSMSTPSINDTKPESAVTRQVAMILFATFLWYFQEPAPNRHVPTSKGNDIPEIARATGEWRLRVKGDGLLSGKHRMQKLERMGLIATADPSVGSQENPETFYEMFISQRAFWQLDPSIYLFTLTPPRFPDIDETRDYLPSLDSFGIGFPFGAGPHTSGSLMPSYYPPIPLQYIFTDGLRHPIRPRAPRQGEVFYTRFVPSRSQNLTLRIPVVPMKGSLRTYSATEQPSNWNGPDLRLDSELINDLKLLHRWMNHYPTNTSLIQTDSLDAQMENLKTCMSSKSSFPALAYWGSTAIGYLEIFWVLEDRLGRLRGNIGDWDRGVRFFIGNNDFNDLKNLALFLSSVVHYCWLCDQRTYSVLVEVGADNERFISGLQNIGFFRESEVYISHEHAVVMKIKRSLWVAPIN
ncbi:hypothetical protein N7509_000035 [Penicillium cosmopolitanum]|uniref:Acyltransferase MbtK/IucB-like conserved domain-containing protein n=1 Tax=Penicillium cosmopolitanum TaxID=1131564 RepID=A0A9W9WCR9_9EURO|nr:uncharacterized protein N7509_000035 [Penicillium cosmopolitanum]KAJ5414937.1 hypothetical protein N7509_000035 [Penicillium cosmopolitanum]